MATVHVAFTSAMGGGAPVLAPKPNASEKITSSATSAATAIAATAGDYARIAAFDGAVFVAVGPAPVALATGADMHVVLAGTTLDLGPFKQGDKIAVIDGA
jgi:hypothetical protein